MKNELLLLLLVFCLLLTGCNTDKSYNNIEETFEYINEEVPEALVLTEDELNLGKKINNAVEIKNETVTEVKENEKTDEVVLTEENIDPYVLYDKYMATAQNITEEEAAKDRQIDLFKIIMCTTNNAMPITEFDDYTLIAILYYVHVDGSMKELYDNCFTEEEVKTFLINKDGMGRLKFSTIINEHKFEK